MNGHLKQYKTSEIQGKSVPELLVMIYNGAIDNLNRAAECYANNDFQGGYTAMEKAKKFVIHLYTTLDEDKGEDIAKNLSKLYSYTIERMTFVQATKDVKIIDDLTKVLGNVREGWAGLIEKEKSRRPDVNNGNNMTGRSSGLSVSA